MMQQGFCAVYWSVGNTSYWEVFLTDVPKTKNHVDGCAEQPSETAETKSRRVSREFQKTRALAGKRGGQKVPCLR